MMRIVSYRYIVLLISVSVFCSPAAAQFIDDFNDTLIAKDTTAMTGWAFFTGDGQAAMDFQQAGGYASILVDATKDTRNVWWALIKRRVSEDLDLNLLKNSNFELRIEAKIRVSCAPRRVNLSLNTNRTTDFHTNLMEFDIPDTTNWHTISMTTHNFDAGPGDTVFGQLALMDWGLEKYRVDLDYFKVDIVNIIQAGPDKGTQVPYHPPVPDPQIFENKIKVAHDCIIDSQFPEMNFNNWSALDDDTKVNLLSVGGTQFVIMRWDLSKFAGRKIAGSGLLELTTHSVQKSSDQIKDFGLIRVVEILAGQPEWDQQAVTFDSFRWGQSIDEVLCPQMIIDVEPAAGDKSKTLITISNPVLQRMIDGETLGLALRPLGAINASFYSSENSDTEVCPRLLFNLKE
jgi:hypothetical protein